MRTPQVWVAQELVRAKALDGADVLALVAAHAQSSARAKASAAS